MGESQHQRQSSRLGLLRSCSAGGEIVEVQGGHIVRSTGRKDRHSKVCTAKGPRDRRVRLSAHTAIQFYDVQDRLGYDRPSKAVDWLIKNAKTAIDKLAELPPWHPTASNAAIATQPSEQDQEDENRHCIHEESQAFDDYSSKRPMEDEPSASEYGFRLHHLSNNPSTSSSFLPPSLDSDAIAKTIKSFFPMAAAATSSSSINFQNYPPDLLSRPSTSQTQDLRLSLQSLQDPILLHHNSSATTSAQQAIFSSSVPLAFDTTSTSWLEQQPLEIGRFQRMVTWNAGTDTGSGGGGFIFNSPPRPTPTLPQFLGQNSLFSQRGPLQSSNSPLARAWMDPSIAATTDDDDDEDDDDDDDQMPVLHQLSVSGIGFTSGGLLSGFHIPARIQGEEEHDAASNKPSSSASRH